MSFGSSSLYWLLYVFPILCGLSLFVSILLFFACFVLGRKFVQVINIILVNCRHVLLYMSFKEFIDDKVYEKGETTTVYNDTIYEKYKLRNTTCWRSMHESLKIFWYLISEILRKGQSPTATIPAVMGSALHCKEPPTPPDAMFLPAWQAQSHAGAERMDKQPPIGPGGRRLSTGGEALARVGHTRREQKTEKKGQSESE